MLASGASAFRVQDGMERLARAVGIERLHVQMTYTTITATAWANGTFRTEVVEQRNLGVNADRIDRFYTEKESLPENQEFVRINNKDTLAQVFTDIRYTKKDNEAMSATLTDVLRQQGFL